MYRDNDISRYRYENIRVPGAGPAVTAQDADGTALGAGPVARRKMQMALKLASGPAVTTQDASSPLNVSRTSRGVRLGYFELGYRSRCNDARCVVPT